LGKVIEQLQSFQQALLRAPTPERFGAGARSFAKAMLANDIVRFGKTAIEIIKTFCLVRTLVYSYFVEVNYFRSA